MSKKKQCSRCKERLPVDRFVFERRGKDGLHSVCKRCQARHPSRRFSNLKKSAIRRGIEVSIDLKDYKSVLESNGYICCYCKGSVNDSSGGGLDRVDSSIGYELGNLKVCCGTCNHMKKDMSESDFIEHINKIYATLREPK